MKRTPFIHLKGSEPKKCKLNLTAWRKKVWVIWDNDTWYKGLIRFCNRNAAIMWLKRYGKNNITYRLERQHGVHALVRVMDGHVWFYNEENGLAISAESKRTCQFATRNN